MYTYTSVCVCVCYARCHSLLTLLSVPVALVTADMRNGVIRLSYSRGKDPSSDV